jgi:hypothetical protein
MLSKMFDVTEEGTIIDEGDMNKQVQNAPLMGAIYASLSYSMS